MASRLLSIVVVVVVFTGLVAGPGRSSADPAALAGSPPASPNESSPLLATMQAKQGATAAAKTATADVYTGETATAEASASEQAVSAARTATATIGTSVANAVSMATQNAELRTAIVGAATSEAEAEQAVATVGALATANAQAGANALATAQAAIDAQATEIAGLYSTETAIALPTATPTPTPSPTATPTDTPTPTPLPQAGDVLFKAGKSAFKKLAGAGGWHYLDGMLINDGSAGFSTVQAPIDLGEISDYAVEADIQVVAGNCPGFGVFARRTDKGAYYGGDLGFDRAGIKIDLGQYPTIAEGRFTNDGDWHTFRLEVNGNRLRLLVDGAVMAETTNNEFLDAGTAGIFNCGDQIDVRTFRIIAL